MADAVDLDGTWFASKDPESGTLVQAHRTFIACSDAKLQHVQPGELLGMGDAGFEQLSRDSLPFEMNINHDGIDMPDVPLEQGLGTFETQAADEPVVVGECTQGERPLAGLRESRRIDDGWPGDGRGVVRREGLGCAQQRRIAQPLVGWCVFGPKYGDADGSRRP